MRLFASPTRQADIDPVDEALARSDSTFYAPRMFDADDTNPVEGTVRWSPKKSLWLTGITITALIGGPFFQLERARSFSGDHRRHPVSRALPWHASSPHPSRL
jgi:hypothetical protein